MVTVALDMGEAEQIDQRQILLDGETGLRGQVLAGHEVIRRSRFGVPVRAARGIQNGFIQTFAAFA